MMKKRILALILTLVMVAALAACGSNPGGAQNDPAPNGTNEPAGNPGGNDAKEPGGSDEKEPAGKPADNTVYKLRLSTTRGDNTWFAKMYDDMIADLAERSDGRLQIEVFHNNTLGAPPDIWTMFTTGSIDMLDMSPGMVGSFPVSEIFNVPFVFEDDNQNLGDMMWELYDAGLLAEYTDNMKVLMYLPGGSLELCTVNKKVESMDDFKGMSLRGSSRTINEAVELLGATAVSIQPSEQTMALSQGILTGVITGANFAEIQSLYESCKYLMNYPIGMSCMFLGINPGSYDKLPADLQQLLVDVCDEYYTEYYLPTVDSEYVAVLDRLANQHGMEIYKPSAEFVADMEAATASQWDAYVASLGAAGLDADAIMAIVDSHTK